MPLFLRQAEHVRVHSLVRLLSYTAPVASLALQPALTRAEEALERGRGAEAVAALNSLLNSGALSRDDELAVRCGLAEAWLLNDDINKASSVLGRPPDVLREEISPARMSTLWRLHGRIAFARGDQSKAIALHGRALKFAEQGHDSHEIGLAHYELGLCYKQVGDTAIVREHIDKAAPALHAAGDRRHSALLNSLSGVSLAQAGRLEEAWAALRQAERLAAAVQATDVLGTVLNNQAIVALIQHRHDLALSLSERSVSLQEGTGSSRGLAISLATQGQIAVRLGDLERAEQILHRALEIRTLIQYHEITGAVYDSLAQIHLMRGSYEMAGDYLRRAGEAYGGYGRQTSLWYEWSIRVLEAKLALRRGDSAEALRLSDEISQPPSVPGDALQAAFEMVQSPAAPPGEAIQAALIACEALLTLDRVDEAITRLSVVRDRIDPRAMPGAWGEYLRVRGEIHARGGRLTEAYHSLAQSANVFDLHAERYQSALSHLALGRLSSQAGTPERACQHLDTAAALFESLGAVRDLDEVRAARSALSTGAAQFLPESSGTAQDAIVERLVDAAALPELLGRETASAMVEVIAGDCAVIFVRANGNDIRVVASAGCDAETARNLARSADRPSDRIRVEPLGRDDDGPRFAAVASSRPIPEVADRRLRMIAAVAHQGFELCASRKRPLVVPESAVQLSLEPLLPGFLCASEAMNLVVAQIKRLQGNDLTVLITGESGTGKELVARAIHTGSPRHQKLFLPYNCTTTTRDLADSQLFGHRRGSFTGAVSDQPGLIRSAAGGSLFLDEIGDLSLDVQPKLLRFLEQGEILPVGEARPQRVDVRVIAATNADLEQRVADGKFREDLYYRLSVIRLHLPPLRERREEIPHLSSLFLREASEQLAKPDVRLSAETLDLFAGYWWPGNVRQLRNEIKRAVALSAPGGSIRPEHLSPDMVVHSVTPLGLPQANAALPRGLGRTEALTLASAVEQVEREMIQATMDRSAGNISEAARALGLTRRGLYLKLRRLGFETRQ